SWVAMAGHVSAGGGRPSYLPGRLLADALALAGSYALFVGPRRRPGEGRRDLETEGPREAGPGSLPPPAPPPPALPPPPRPPPWLAWRQGRAELAVVGTAAFVLGVGFTAQAVLLWPVVTLLVGVVYGTGVWAREQADASYRFLTNQRLPPGRVWLAKTAW